MGEFAPAVGRRYAGRGGAYPKGPTLAGPLLAEWGVGHAEPWLVLTDLPPGAANPAWYAWRMGIEQGFRAIKRGQWQWHKTQVSSADRVARQWAVPAERRRLSALRVGLQRLFQARVDRGLLPMGRLVTRDWPKRDWEGDPLTEDMMNRC